MDVTNPRTMTELESDLIKNLIDTIVEPQVIEPMEKIGWTHDAPPDPTPKVIATPASEAAPVTETHKPTATPATTAPLAETSVTTTAVDWESLREANGLILGKYKNESEATKGVSHAVAMAKDALNKAALLEEENAKLRESITARPVATFTPETKPLTTTAPVQSNDLDLILAKIVEEGGTIDELNVKELKDALLKTASEAAVTKVNQVLTEQDSAKKAEDAAWNQVDKFMRTNYPDSVNFTDEINLFVNTDPMTGTVVRTLLAAGKKEEAAVTAWQNYARAASVETNAKIRTNNIQKETVLDAADQVRKEAVERARIDAGVPTTTAGGIHESPEASTSREEIEAAAAGMAAGDVGSAILWRKLTVGRDLSGPLFD